ncbi:hypothetical protein ACQUW5_13150 [Legionella sp. CNM-1927-20]|uniref:hypothetical protein n=1 Tax=Legionella sp. CNM-1927-20 TaxID=3422221 RepID=UPI00403B0CCE
MQHKEEKFPPLSKTEAQEKLLKNIKKEADKQSKQFESKLLEDFLDLGFNQEDLEKIIHFFQQANVTINLSIADF